MSEKNLINLINVIEKIKFKFTYLLILIDKLLNG